MSISVVGAAAGGTGATTVAIPAHQPGDMIIIGYGSTVSPVIPSAGGTVPAWQTLQTGVANSASLAVVYAIATASNHTSGTWASGKLTVVVLRSNAGTLSTAPARSSVGNANNTQTMVFPALTLGKTDGSSMGVRVGQRGVNAAGLMTPPSGWTIQAFNPASTPNIVLHTRLGLTTNPAADSVSASGSNAPYRAVTVEVQELPPPTPSDETIIDDFNRADAKITIGRPDLWYPDSYEPNSIYDMDVIGNQLAGTVFGAMAKSKIWFAADFDFVIDCVVASTLTGINGVFRFFCCEDASASSDNCYDIRWNAQGDINVYRVTGGSNTPIGGTGSAPAPAAGDTIWVRRRGSAFTLLRRPSGGIFSQIHAWTDSNYMRAGPFDFQGALQALQRWDNLRGGPLAIPPAPLDETLIDNFNRADARVDAGLGATIWKSAWYDGGVATDMRVINNQLGLLAAQYTPAYTLRSIQNSCDIVIDCIAPPVAPNNEFGLYFCMSDVPSAAFDGYAIFWSAGTWILRRYLNGVNVGNITTAAGTLVAGDSVWVSKVGSAIKLYKKSSVVGANYGLILQATDANHNLPGKIVLELSDTTQRWENLRGGPFVSASRSVLII